MITEIINLHKEEYDVYIGREGKGQSGYFGNPHTGPDKEANVKLYKAYFHDRIKTDKEFAQRILKLRGKILGCFCKPRPCHGDVIAEYLNALPEPNPLKLAVVGSRNFVDYEYMCQMLDWFEIKKIISGGANGADSLALKYAEDHRYDYQEFPAEWTKHGRSAGFIRNKLIVDACDEVVAFWISKSKGTKHSIDLALKAGKPVHIFEPNCIKRELYLRGYDDLEGNIE